MNQKHLQVLTISFLVSLFLIACTEPDSAPIRLGTNRWPGYEPLYLARELGFLQPDSVRLVEYPSATEAMYAMRSQSIEMAALTLDEALVLIQDGVAIKVILIMDFSAGAHAVISKPEIQNLSQLEGKRIAFESGAVGAIMLDALLKSSGLSIDQVTLVNRTVNHHLKVYDQNEADAIVTFEPILSELLAKGGVRLFDSKAIPGRIIDVLVIQSDILESNMTRVRHLINAWFQALEKMQNEPDKALPILAKRLGLTALQMKTAFQGLILPDRESNKKYLLNSDQLKIQANALQDLMLKRELLQKRTSIETVFLGSAL